MCACLFAVGQVTNQLRAVMATSCVYYLITLCGCVLSFECVLS